jgi:hypothetical protein
MNLREKIKKIIKEELSQEESLPIGVELFDKVDSNLMWVRVLKGQFFNNKDCEGNYYGIGCQTSAGMGIATNFCGGNEI